MSAFFEARFFYLFANQTRRDLSAAAAARSAAVSRSPVCVCVAVCVERGVESDVVVVLRCDFRHDE